MVARSRLQFEGGLNNLNVLVVPGLAVIVIWAIGFSRGYRWAETPNIKVVQYSLVGCS